jgi:hypothetical protein
VLIITRVVRRSIVNQYSDSKILDALDLQFDHHMHSSIFIKFSFNIGNQQFFQRQESIAATVIQGILSVRILILIYLISVNNFDSMRVTLVHIESHQTL